MSETELRFQKYERIDGTWQEKAVKYLREQGFDHPDILWNITEKVHGSNFAFYMNQDDLKVAKRSAFLVDGENFFQYLRMKEANGYKVRELWNHLCALEKYDIKELIVYGELFGGFYPHPDVERVPNVRKIQKGVYYHPDVNFYCFDIKLNGEFLPMDFVNALCEITNIFCAKILLTGTFDDCLNYSNKFQTTLPDRYNLPEIEGNICEGVVMKPFDDLRYDDADRVILKSKNEKFMEVSKEPREIRKQTHELSEFAIDTLEKIATYINENRLRNVLSKFGNFKKQDFNVILNLFKKDIYENFNMDHDDLKNIEKMEKKEIEKMINRLIIEIWRPIFLVEAEIK